MRAHSKATAEIGSSPCAIGTSFTIASVLIVGDSMARQLFMTVVGRLRGHSAIFDQQLFDATYVQPSLS